MAKKKTVDNLYLDWLMEKTGLDKNTYYMLLSSMHAYAFTPVINMDENREMDGESMRSVFAEEYLKRPKSSESVFPLSEIAYDPNDDDDMCAYRNASTIIYVVLDRPCSMLEMLVALSRRMAYFVPSSGTSSKRVKANPENIDEETAKKCFRGFIRNLDLLDVTDEAYPQVKVRNKLTSAMNRLNNRTYEYNGNGGLFPLRNPPSDQRKTEIWYQMNAYILEQYEKEYEFDG